MLAYKKEVSQEDGLGFKVQCSALRVQMEEQEDGEERPDLNLSLTISPVGPPPPRIGH